MRTLTSSRQTSQRMRRVWTRGVELEGGQTNAQMCKVRRMVTMTTTAKKIRATIAVIEQHGTQVYPYTKSREAAVIHYLNWVLSLLKTDRMALRTKIETSFTEALEMDDENAGRNATLFQRIILLRGELITTRNKLCAELESKREKVRE